MISEPNMIVRTIVAELEDLPDEKIVEVLDFVRFLRVRYGINGKRYAPRVLNKERLAQLYAESADEDVQLAETGITDYAEGLKREDSNAEG